MIDFMGNEIIATATIADGYAGKTIDIEISYDGYELWGVAKFGAWRLGGVLNDPDGQPRKNIKRWLRTRPLYKNLVFLEETVQPVDPNDPIYWD